MVAPLLLLLLLLAEPERRSRCCWRLRAPQEEISRMGRRCRNKSSLQAPATFVTPVFYFHPRRSLSFFLHLLSSLSLPLCSCSSSSRAYKPALFYPRCPSHSVSHCFPPARALSLPPAVAPHHRRHPTFLSLLLTPPSLSTPTPSPLPRSSLLFVSPTPRSYAGFPPRFLRLSPSHSPRRHLPRCC